MDEVTLWTKWTGVFEPVYFVRNVHFVHRSPCPQFLGKKGGESQAE